jgi:hypothetical protein
MKIIRPAVINKWKTQRFKLSNLVRSDRNELVLGIDVNHVYIVFKDAVSEREWTRADLNVRLGEFIIRKKNDTIADGIFFKFKNVQDGDLENIRLFIGNRQSFFSCAAGTCAALAEAGIHLGSGNGPATTEELLQRVFVEGFKDNNEVPLEVEVFTTSAEPLQSQVDQAIKVSRVLRDFKAKNLKGLLAIFRYGGKTVLRWLFYWPHPIPGKN